MDLSKSDLAVTTNQKLGLLIRSKRGRRGKRGRKDKKDSKEFIVSTTLQITINIEPNKLEATLGLATTKKTTFVLVVGKMKNLIKKETNNYQKQAANHL